MTRRIVVACMLMALMTVSACALFRQVAALRLVDFALDRITETRLADVAVDRIQRYEDIRPVDVARIGGALARGRLPLEFQLHVAAENPQDNQVDARLLQMDWTISIEGRETVSGILDREYILPAGHTTMIPILIRLDLVQFFGNNLRDLVDIALSLTGEGGTPRTVSLEATPTIQTPIGPIRYPRPTTIVSRTVG